MQVTTNLLRFAAIVGFATVFTGCETLSLKGKKSEEKEAETKEVADPVLKIPIGTVHHVDTAGGFVLIRSSRTLLIEPGTVITTFTDQGEVAATLEVSPARKGQFLTADIRNGIPKTGQQAVMDYDPASRTAPLKEGTVGPSPGGDIQVLE